MNKSCNLLHKLEVILSRCAPPITMLAYLQTAAARGMEIGAVAKWRFLLFRHQCRSAIHSSISTISCSAVCDCWLTYYLLVANSVSMGKNSLEMQCIKELADGVSTKVLKNKNIVTFRRWSSWFSSIKDTTNRFIQACRSSLLVVHWIEHLPCNHEEQCSRLTQALVKYSFTHTFQLPLWARGGSLERHNSLSAL